MCIDCMESFHDECERRDLTPGTTRWHLTEIQYEEHCNHEEDEIPELRVSDEE